MIFSNYRFTLDVQKAQAQISIPVRYRDTGHMLYITLADGGQPYRIGEGCRAVFYAKKPNGSPLINDCYIEDEGTVVRYDFNAHTANVAGVHYCEVRIIDEMERVITSPSFIMVVDERVVFDDDIITDEDRDTLLALDVIASEADRRSAEFDREENEQLRSVAEDEREGAEIARVTAENARVSAENARKSAENARVSAENARVSAEIIREQKLSQFDSRITGVERYLSGENFVIDDTTAYEKKVPSNACEKAKVLSIGGMTYKKKTDEGNLMPYPYVGIGGLSYKVANGAITVTSGEETDFIISSGDAVYPAGTYVFEVGEQEADYVQQIGLQFYGTAPTVTQLSNYKCQFTATSNFTITRFTARFSSSYNAQGEFTVTLYPMLYKTDAPITWQPRGYYMSHTKVKAIESKSKNLYDGEQNIVLSSTAVEEIIFEKPISETVTLSWKYSGNAESPDAAIFCIVTSDGTEKYVGLRAVFVTYDDISKIILLNWAELNGTLYDIQLEYGDTATEFSPFSTIDTFNIPEVVQAREGYGLGTPEISNYFRYNDGKVKEFNYCKELIFDGENVDTSYMNESNGYHYFSIYLPYFGIEGAYNNYSVVSTDYTIDMVAEPGYAYATNEGFTAILCYPADQTLDTVEKVNTWAKERNASGNPIKFVVGAKTPTIKDITDIMPDENLIKVLGRGRIVAENEQSDPVPFGIKYLVTYQRGDA